jgi:cytochrome c553
MIDFRLNRSAVTLALLMFSGGLCAEIQKLDEKVSAILPLCASCHGIDGISSVGLYPNLAGQQPEYLAKQLHDFKTGRRQDPVMRPIAEPLDDATIGVLSRYFSTQKPSR